MTRGFSTLSTGALGVACAACALLACSASHDDPKSSITRDVTADRTSAPAASTAPQPGPFGLLPLSSEPIPRPTNVHIVDQAAAVRLGKTFFWDTQAGGDGKVACATCHASHGTDQRLFNTLNPGYDGIFASGGVTGPDQRYTRVIITNDDVDGVQGVVNRTFVSINPDPKIADETCTPVVDPSFGTARQVEFRQAPMIYGAVFFRELFWAGEANQQFNGQDIWGFTGNSVLPPLANEDNAALASQSVGPPHNPIEMSCNGRPFNGPNSLGAKMLARPPLQFQRVSVWDSVLGELANPHGPGLRCDGGDCTYRGLIAQAYGERIAANAENVFSVIWGESLQAYESTLIPDRTPYDRYVTGHPRALTPRQQQGLDLFVNKGKCTVCHAGPEFSDATVSYFQANGPVNRDGGDQGFHNIGLEETFTDGGRGIGGANGIALSFTGSNFDNWAFKTPTLRNLKLSAPYFHNGGKPTLEDVVDFYNRGGDYPSNPEISADIKPLGLTADEQAALVDFLREGLNDCRVEMHKAPFDHPELSVVNGDYMPEVGAEGDGWCPGEDGAPWGD